MPRRPPPHPPVTQQQLPSLVLLYLAVARADADVLDAHERDLALQLALKWAPGVALADVEATVDTACLAARSGLGLDVEALAEEVRAILPHEAQLRLLSDLGLMARADGHLTQREAEVIGRARSLLDRPGGAEA